MRPQPVLPVTVKPLEARELEARLQKVKERIRRRAYDLYCGRTRKGTPLEDWKQAENECCAAPLAGMAEEENDIRITACVPGASAGELVVDVLPDEIVVEADRNGEIQRFKCFHLPATVDPKRVEAHLHGTELDVVAPKACPPADRAQRPSR